jgi:hypothetical protein
MRRLWSSPAAAQGKVTSLPPATGAAKRTTTAAPSIGSGQHAPLTSAADTNHSCTSQSRWTPARRELLPDRSPISCPLLFPLPIKAEEGRQARMKREGPSKLRRRQG